MRIIDWSSDVCSSDLLVIDDMLGMFERVPRFVNRYGDMASEISAAVQAYAGAVRSRAFPGEVKLYLPKARRRALSTGGAPTKVRPLMTWTSPLGSEKKRNRKSVVSGRMVIVRV